MDSGRRRTLKTVAPIVVAIIIVIAVSVVVWYTLIRPRTIREVMEMNDLRPGTAIELEGTITGVRRENTSYGPTVLLELDHFKGLCQAPNQVVDGTVFGDPSASYRLGDRFHTTLHIQAYRFNGDPAVWAPELACPFPGLLRAIGVVWDAVGLITGGFSLVFRPTGLDRWSTYEVLTTTGDAFRLDVLPVTLRKSTPLGQPPISGAPQWIVTAGVEYVKLSGMFVGFPVVDSMASLASAASANGTLRFVDSNGNGLADDGDLLQVRLPDTESATAYDSYLLQVGGINGPFSAYAYSGHYILNGPTGPYEAMEFLLRNLVQLRHLGDQPGPTVNSTLEVARVRLGAPLPTSGLGFQLAVNGTEEAVGNLSSLPLVFPNGMSISFADANGLLDAGDRFVLGNLGNRSSVSFRLFNGSVGVGVATWIAGYGHVVGIVPRNIGLAAQGSGPYRVEVTVPYWHPELALNRTARASLWENSTLVLSDVPLSNGTVGTFPGGSLAFTDADGDGYLSSGDSFFLTGRPGTRYELRLSLLFGTVDQRVLLGP